MLNLSTTQASVAAIKSLRFVVDTDAAFIEWSDETPLELVQALIEGANYHGVVFDIEDPDLWEYPTGGFRLHGMFIDDLI